MWAYSWAVSDSADRTYEFCLRFFADLRACGVQHCVVSPGSRSTPLALCAQAAGLDMTVHIDERVAAFHALGQAKATDVASVLICTSGTAGANYFPAVIEAHHSGIPMIVCTADRPPELRGWGAGQTIDQVGMFGSNVRWFHELPVPGEVSARHAGVVALRAASTALHGRGPVHLNWPFREPLTPTAKLVSPNSSLAAVAQLDPSAPSARLAELADQFENGLVVVGPDALHASVAAEILAFSRHWGWPIVADPASGLRVGNDTGAVVVTTAELLLASSPFTARLGVCDVILRVGSAPTSKSYRLWVESSPPAKLVVVAPRVEWADPTSSATEVVPGPLCGLFGSEASEPRSSAWSRVWQSAELAAGNAIDEFVSTDTSELALAASLLGWLNESPEPASLIVSNSMPIRDLDIVLRSVADNVKVHANRGANGIDGMVATAAGVAHATAQHTVAFLGDVAAVHDLGGLAAASRLGTGNLTVVVVDNDAGGIFSFLPVASVIEPEIFDELFATPHGTDLALVARAFGYTVTSLDQPSQLAELVLSKGPNLILLRTTADETVAAIRSLRDRVAAAVG